MRFKDTLMCENCGIRPATQEHVERNALNDNPQNASLVITTDGRLDQKNISLIPIL